VLVLGLRIGINCIFGGLADVGYGWPCLLRSLVMLDQNLPDSDQCFLD